MFFKEVIGQDRQKKQLIHTVSEGRISHAQLFLGKAGYGTLPLALAYARYILCINKQADDACGKCTACVKINKLAHPDLHFSFPVSTNSQVKSSPKSDDFIQDWRTFVLEKKGYFNLDDWHKAINIETKQSQINVEESQSIIKKLSLKTYEAKHKILLIWMPERMNVQASNKLLKLIEEPTPNTVLILVAEEEEELMKTITSRTQKINVPPILKEVLANYLVENFKLEKERIAMICAFSEGDFLAAKNRLDKPEEEEQFFEYFKEWMRSCHAANIDKMYAWVEELSSRNVGREKQKRFISYALEVMREGLLRNYMGKQLSRFEGKESQFMIKFAPFVHENNIFGIVELLTDAHYHISRNAYAKILFMDVSMKFANLLRVKKRTFVD